MDQPADTLERPHRSTEQSNEVPQMEDMLPENLQEVVKHLYNEEPQELERMPRFTDTVTSNEFIVRPTEVPQQTFKAIGELGSRRIVDGSGNVYTGTSLSNYPGAEEGVEYVKKLTPTGPKKVPQCISEPPLRQGNDEGFNAIKVVPHFIPKEHEPWHNCGRTFPDIIVWHNLLKYEDPTKFSQYHQSREPNEKYGKRCFGFLQMRYWISSPKSQYPLAICPRCESLNFILPDNQISNVPNMFLFGFPCGSHPFDIKPINFQNDPLWEIYIKWRFDRDIEDEGKVSLLDNNNSRTWLRPDKDIEQPPFERERCFNFFTEQMKEQLKAQDAQAGSTSEAQHQEP